MTSFYSPTSVHRAERCHNAEGMCREIPIGTIERYCGARQCFLSIEAKRVTPATIITELESLFDKLVRPPFSISILNVNEREQKYDATI
jgi:hypothetical protein